jgi:hypothetical protein
MIICQTSCIRDWHWFWLSTKFKIFIESLSSDQTKLTIDALNFQFQYFISHNFRLYVMNNKSQ